MTTLNPYQAPAVAMLDTPADVTDAPEPLPIRGWLLLVGLGVLISPFRLVRDMYGLYINTIPNGTWAMLTDPGSEAYHPMWKPLLLAEAGANFLMVILWIFLNILFFRKQRQFPRWYIGALVGTLTIMVLDAWALNLINPELLANDKETFKEIGRSLLAVCIWVPYILLSKRVKATFVR